LGQLSKGAFATEEQSGQFLGGQGPIRNPQPYLEGQTIRSQAAAEQRPITTQDLATGAMKAGVKLDTKTAPSAEMYMAQGKKPMAGEEFKEEELSFKKGKLGTDTKKSYEEIIRKYKDDANAADKEIAALNKQKDELKQKAKADAANKAKTAPRAEREAIKNSWYESIAEQDKAIDAQIKKQKDAVEQSNREAARIGKEHKIDVQFTGTAAAKAKGGKGKGAPTDADYAAFYEKNKSPNDPPYEQLTPAQKQHVQMKYQK
jgi:hypothetical protein